MNRPIWHLSACLRAGRPVKAAWRSGVAPLLAALVLACAAAHASGQDAVREGAEACAGQGAAAQEAAGQGTAGEAAEACAERPDARDPPRPPGDHPADVFDVLSVPLRVAAIPLALVGYAAREALRLAFPAERERGVPGAIGVMDELGERGLRATFPSLGPRAGPALGLRLEPYGPLFAETALSWRLYRRHAAGVELGDPLGRTSARLAAILRHERAPHFWGTGARTQAGERAVFRWDQREVSARARFGVPGGAVAVGGALEHNRTAAGRGGEVPTLVDVMEPGALFGLGETTRYLRGSASVRAEAVRWRALQPRGGEVEAEAHLFRGIAGTPSDFLRLHLRGAAHLPVNPFQQLVLFARMEAHETLGRRGVPFTHMASLGGGVGGRAYEAGRFRDRALAAGGAEWRYELWRTIHDDARVEAFLFAETGTVARAPGALSARALRGSWGAGLRSVDAAGLRAVGFLALGAEGARVGGALIWPH